MRGRVRSISGHETTRLVSNWAMCLTAPGLISHPRELANATLSWMPATVPSTAASTLRAAGAWSLDGPPRRFDAEDVWYRTRLTFPPAAPGAERVLCLDGLATVAEVWLDGELLLSSQNMFLAHEIPLGARLLNDCELAIVFRALDPLLTQRRPRPRWRAPMVENQQLRWWRTTLLGRTPGWSPPAAVVGPWREIRVERRAILHVDEAKLTARVNANEGHLEIAARIATFADTKISGVEIVLKRGSQVWKNALNFDGNRAIGSLIVPNVKLWWPHTHGEPALYSARLRVQHAAGVCEVDLGEIGFRTLQLNTDDGDFALSVNGEAIFCRGACWTPLDVVSLGASPESIENAVAQARDCGMNMLRLSGALVDESDAFYDACDRQGILIWHDFLFANLDYPNDESFIETVGAEARQLLARLTGRPSLAVLCGNSEVEQQAAMWGAARELWQPRLFHEILPQLARELCPDVPYWPSSAHGGAFPHQADSGTTSYYGVGAYLRPLNDARRADVRFASECLAFANIPGESGLAALPGGLATKAHSANWKARSPRDLGASWDFDDVRDHYLKQLFGLDPVALRSTAHDRYLELSRVVTGEVMAAVFAEWRRENSRTRGALIWFLRDLWPGAGWGVVDADGAPKAAWHYLRRAFAPLAVFISDEGQSGLALHLVNERPEALDSEIEIAFYRDGEIPVGGGHRKMTLAAHETIEINAGELLNHFVDTSYAYRFGPPSHDVVVAGLRDSDGALRSQFFHFPLGLPSARRHDLGLSAEARPLENGNWMLRAESRVFAQSVFVDVAGFDVADNYFHLAPGGVRDIVLRPHTSAKNAPVGNLYALNSDTAIPIATLP